MKRKAREVVVEEPVSEAELAALVAHLREAEAELSDLEHDLTVLAQREAELRDEEVDVAIGTADAGRHELAEAELEAETAATLQRRDRQERVVEGLRSRCADLAETIGRAAEAEIAERMASRSARIEQFEAALVDERHAQANDEQRLQEAREATSRGRVPFDPEAAKSARERERQESERIRSWARMPKWRLEVERLSPATLAKVETERARLAAEVEARRTRDAEQAAASWAEAGLSGTKPTFLDG